MRIVTLLENNISPRAAITADTNELKNAHGLSLYLETADHRILFDMGPGDEIAHNARNLSIDLAAVDLAAISHGHYDHGGGLATFLSLNTTAPFYTTVRAFENHNLPSPANDCLRDDAGLDHFEHEQNLLVAEDNTLVLIGGCAHRGIVNIIEAAKQIAGRYPDVVISGFHLAIGGNGACAVDDAYLDEFATRLIQTGATFYTGHCTGSEAYERLAIRMGGILLPCYTGDNMIV